uniref:Gustatory receptor n=1 Tax=Anopheles farauti TaxID=69004 RepID=A0A182QSK9_9DIPT
MGLFRELRGLLRLFVWSGLLPYVPPAPREAVLRRRAQRLYLIRLCLALLLFTAVSYLKVTVLNGYSMFMYSLSYVVWLLATLVDTVGIMALLIVNGLNAAQFGTLVELVVHVEQAIDGWTLGSGRPSSYPPYRWYAMAVLIVCLAYHTNRVMHYIDYSVHVILQIRFEEWITDMYLFYVILLLYAIGRCAKHLRRMLQDTIRCEAVAELCVVMRLRDDLLHCVELVSRVYGHVFMAICASWLVSITCIVYFDFILSGLQLNINQPYVFEHGVMLLRKSALVGGLVAVTGAVAERIKAITGISQHGETHHTLQNRPLTKLIDKLLLKSQFQDIRFTIYGVIPIDNSLSYMLPRGTRQLELLELEIALSTSSCSELGGSDSTSVVVDSWRSWLETAVHKNTS